jgi:hypothetical protein
VVHIPILVVEVAAKVVVAAARVVVPILMVEVARAEAEVLIPILVEVAAKVVAAARVAVPILIVEVARAEARTVDRELMAEVVRAEEAVARPVHSRLKLKRRVPSCAIQLILLTGRRVATSHLHQIVL